MDVKLPNPSLVYRQFGEKEICTELVAICQYQSDAEQLAKAKLAEDVARNWHGSWYLVISTYDGQASTFSDKKETSNGT